MGLTIISLLIEDLFDKEMKYFERIENSSYFDFFFTTGLALLLSPYFFVDEYYDHLKNKNLLLINILISIITISIFSIFFPFPFSLLYSCLAISWFLIFYSHLFQDKITAFILPDEIASNLLNSSISEKKNDQMTEKKNNDAN